MCEIELNAICPKNQGFSGDDLSDKIITIMDKYTLVSDIALYRLSIFGPRVFWRGTMRVGRVATEGNKCLDDERITIVDTVHVESQELRGKVVAFRCTEVRLVEGSRRGLTCIDRFEDDLIWAIALLFSDQMCQ